jgi:plastocyanin
MTAHTWKWTAASIAAAFAVAACSGGGDGGGGGVGPGPTQGTISGTVGTGTAGIAGTDVTLGAQSVTTGTTGQFTFNQVSPGTHTVTIVVPVGFQLPPGETAAKQVSVSGGQTATVNWILESSAPGGTIDIQIGTSSFSPADRTIAPNTMVRWIASGGGHTITPDNPGQPGGWSRTVVNSGGVALTHLFGTAGDFPYHCEPHQAQGMTGIVRVQ